MKRHLLPLVALLGLVPVVLALISSGRERLDQDRVYTVAEVQAEPAQRPGAWVGAP